jgi:RNA polymerase sigma-70 factor, ECF subfamily
LIGIDLDNPSLIMVSLVCPMSITPRDSKAIDSQSQQSSSVPMASGWKGQPDLVVINALQAGDEKAVGEIYDRYGLMVYRLALKILGNSNDAEDLTQEVFVNFWQGANKYEPQRGALSTFLAVVTRSRALNKLRQNKSRQNLAEQYGQNYPHSVPATGLDTAHLETLADRVGAALAQIPLEQRQTIELAYYGGLSQSTIANQLEIPLGTVKTRSRQGLLKLKTLLQDLV